MGVAVPRGPVRSGCSRGRGRSTRPIGPRMPGVAGFRPSARGMKVPLRLIPKITVHTAAHDNKSNDPAPRGCRRPGSRCHWWAGSPNPPGWTPRTPRRGGCWPPRLRHVGQGISAALGRGGGVVGVRGAGERCQGFGQDRPVDLVEHSGDRPHPCPCGQAQGPFGALLIQAQVQVGGVVGLSGDLQYPAHLRGVGLGQADDRGFFAGEVIDGRGVGQDLIHMQPRNTAGSPGILHDRQVV